MRLPTWASAAIPFGGTFDYERKKERLAEVELDLAEPDVWNTPDRAQALGRERSDLELVVSTIDTLEQGIADCRELIHMAVEEDDADSIDEVKGEIDALETQ